MHAKRAQYYQVDMKRCLWKNIGSNKARLKTW